MLRLRSLTLQDFGPFKGEQRIDFLEGPGVTVIRGNNGLGKTKFLNAIRYALFGHVVGRTDTPQDLTEVANWEAKAERGFAEFKVVLEFDSDGIPYRLTRRYANERGTPTTEVLLVRQGETLTQAESLKELERILPEQIARFFLFDGELLRQYEELARDPSRGDDLKRAIERILGIPVLTNARTDVVTISSRVTAALAQAAAANRQTEQLGVSLQTAQTLLNQYRTDLRELEGQLEQLEHERTELEERMARTGRFQTLFARRDVLKEEAGRHEIQLAESQQALAEGSSEAWRAVLAPRVDELLGQVDRDIGVLEERERERAMAAAMHSQRKMAAETGECPTCGQHLSDVLREHLHDDEAADSGEDLTSELQRLRVRRDMLRPLQDRGAAGSIAQLEARVEDHEVALADLRRDLEGLEEQLGGAPPERELQRIALDYANVTTIITNTRERHESVTNSVNEQDTAVRNLRDELAKLGGAASESLDRKAEILQQLEELFGLAVAHYRERLRGNVEAEATRIFRLLRTQEEYDRLQINDGYGLTIIHQDGTPITDRSAGYEHLVAISLLGALQRSAPIRGPVIMDSPFGRLDPEHKRRVVASLPEIADQVVLLVYEGEFDRVAAAEALGPRLLAEHQLVGVTARHTDIGGGG